MYYAHSNQSLDKDLWQPLEAHLRNVAEQSKAFLVQSGFDEAAYIQGLLHDAGKYSFEFQQKLEGKRNRVDHSTAGAKIAFEKYGGIGKLMAYCICGHHGGLPDGVEAGFESTKSSLKVRLNKKTDTIDNFWEENRLPNTLEVKRTNPSGFRLAFYTRMLFSALVDADYLDTEAYYSPQAVNQRCNWATLEQLEPVFINYMVNKQNAANKNCINLLRMDIYKNCLEAARQKTGLFSLSVPTGGGKTLSSMAFAFAHAKKHGMKRIIYAIPFTSIIEQNAAVFREALGDRAVLEHHSHYNFEDDLEGTERLAAENWDAPVIVTTNVQLFESLFENKPSKCRKLHNLAQSVIVLDEMQTLPDGLLKPCLAALQCLCEDFGASVVMCTATQPAVDFVWPDPAEVREIVADPSGLYSAFKKVDVSYLGVVDNKDLVERIRKDKQVLCIVNTRKHARELYKILSESEEEGIFHLSALMCPEHRTLKLDAIRDRLKDGLLCRVISTQLIEAGVDIDFPVVYRAAAGIDSIAQAAGRCNREGKLKKGETFVFYPPDGVPSGWFQRMAALGAEIMKSGADPLSMETVKHFFQRRYSDAGLGGLDEHDILGQCKNGMRYLEFPFEQMAREFHFIPSAGKQVIIPFDVQCREILREAEESVHSWQFARLLQKYTVTVYPYEFEQMMRAGIIKQIGEAFISLQTDSAGYRNIYSDATGLNIEPEKEILVI